MLERYSGSTISQAIHVMDFIGVFGERAVKINFYNLPLVILIPSTTVSHCYLPNNIITIALIVSPSLWILNARNHKIDDVFMENLSQYPFLMSLLCIWDISSFCDCWHTFIATTLPKCGWLSHYLRWFTEISGALA